MKVGIMSKDGHKEVDLNRRQAIRERCLNCKGWYHKEVINCIFTHCFLHPFRTGKGRQNSTRREKAIKQYCHSCMNIQVGEVKKCTVPDCPLFIYRKGGVEKALKNLSLKTLKHIGAVFLDSS